MPPPINTNVNSSPNWISAYPQGPEPTGINSAGVKPLSIDKRDNVLSEFEVDDFAADLAELVKAEEADVAGALAGYKDKKVSFGERIKNGISSLCRHLQSACRNIRQLFTGKIEVSNTPHEGKVNINLPANSALSDVKMDKVLMARKLNADALDSARSFTYADLNLQEASLRDIKQRAGLQDCWLLSSISSMVVTLGTGHLSNIIKPNITADNVEDGFLVRLGNKTYAVPSKELSHGGERIFSNSAPWVNVLECAMQMHLIDQMYGAAQDDVIKNGEKKFDLAYRTPREALNVLMPGAQVQTKGVGDSKEVKLDFIANSLKEGAAVVLGKREGYASALFTDGVATDHAVSVVDVSVAEKKENSTVDILDPYGRMVRLTMDQLSNFDVFAAATQTQNDAIMPNVAGQPEVNVNEP